MTKKTFGPMMALALVITSVLVAPLSTQACSCIARVTTPKEEVETAKGVFYGKVVSVTNSTSTVEKVVIFNVEKYWKGEIANTQVVYTGQDSAMCGFAFEKDHSYLVFTYNGGEENSQHHTTLCSQTMEVASDSKEVKSLGEPKQAPSAANKFTTNLSLGMNHSDVELLQSYLNGVGFTVAATGPGSTGNETTYFGPRTRDALMKFQTANAAKLGISSGTGYFGPLTRDLVKNLTVPVTTN